MSSIKNTVVGFILSASKLLDEPKLNKSLCLIFNGVATMNAITFIVLFIIGKTSSLLAVGIAGCLLMTLANITDIIPSFLNWVAKRILITQTKL